MRVLITSCAAGHLLVHGVERQADEGQRVARPRGAQVEQHVEALARGEERFLHRARPIEQAAVGPDDLIIQQLHAVTDSGMPSNVDLDTSTFLACPRFSRSAGDRAPQTTA